MPSLKSKLLIAVLTGWIAAAACAAEDFPYEAYVAVEQADVVAGPGHRFYVTSRLPLGTKVEIYREEASGWLAIRPPEDSFCWVPADFVERLDDDKLARVTEATGAWIGTSVEHVSEHEQQVTLKPGELVQVLGEKAVNARSGAERSWLKIAPPAGEYRWVYLRDVSRQKPDPNIDPVVDEEPDRQSTLAAALSRGEREQPEEPRRLELVGNAIALRSIDERAARFDRRVEPAQYRGSATSNPPQVLSSDGFVPRKRRDADQAIVPSSHPQGARAASDSRSRLDATARLSSVVPSPTAQSPAAQNFPARNRVATDELSRQLDQIELDLSLMVAQDRSQWKLAEIERRVQALVESGDDPASRGRARLVLDKIRQFENTFEAANEPRPPSVPRQAATGPPSASSALADPRYDAQGTLKEVISRKSAKPAAPFAVVDSEGQPVCFVSPSPGLNLNRYLNKPVGLYGRRGYMEELKKPHVVAERVIELDSRRR